MASFQTDFKADAKGSYELITTYKSTEQFKHAIDGSSYFNGENTVISKMRRWYWKEWKTRADDGTITTGGGYVPNLYVANNHIAYGFFKDMVIQKVDTLFRENPTINTANGYEVDKKFIKQFGYAMRIGAETAAKEGYGLLFLDANNQINILPASQTIVFYDDNDGRIRAVIYFYEIKSLIGQEIRWFVFSEEGVQAFSNKSGTPIAIDEIQPYKYSKIQSYFTSDIIKQSGIIPIIEFDNNKLKKSDLTNNIKSKIDIIDIVQSGFANNIEDFSDIYMVMKDAVGGGEEYYQDFMANIARTHKIIGDGVELKQLDIPTTARDTFVKIMKEELVQDGGVCDMKALLNGNLTATAIHAARANLETRVSAFEWQCDKAANEFIELYQKVNGLQFEFDVTFNKYTLNNVTETINNAVMLYGKVSEETFLNLLKGADIIDDVEKEKERIADESLSKYGAGGGIYDDAAQ